MKPSCSNIGYVLGEFRNQMKDFTCNECRECNAALVEHIGERKSREKDALLLLKLLLLL
jgi:hypothetical protein